MFRKHQLDAELREIDRPDEDDPIGKVVYLVNLSTSISTDKLNEEVFSGDREHIDTVEWKQKESQTYIYK